MASSIVVVPKQNGSIIIEIKVMSTFWLLLHVPPLFSALFNNTHKSLYFILPNSLVELPVSMMCYRIKKVLDSIYNIDKVSHS